MRSLLTEGIEQYAYDSTGPEPAYLAELEQRTRAEMAFPQMLTGRLEGRLLKLLVRIHRPKLVLEVGTFTGYSALSMAEGLPDGGRIVTCEVDSLARDMAQSAFDASPFADRIELYFGPALKSIAAIAEPIDFAFIDADKENYSNYYEAVLSRMPTGGVIVFDNMLWSGKVLEPKAADDKALARLNETLASDGRVDNVLLTVRDGVQLVIKK